MLSQSWCTNLLRCFPLCRAEVMPGSVPALGSQTSARCPMSCGHLKMRCGRASMHSWSRSLVASQDLAPARVQLRTVVPLHVVGKLDIFLTKSNEVTTSLRVPPNPSCQRMWKLKSLSPFPAKGKGTCEQALTTGLRNHQRSLCFA